MLGKVLVLIVPIQYVKAYTILRFEWRAFGADHVFIRASVTPMPYLCRHNAQVVFHSSLTFLSRLPTF